MSEEKRCPGCGCNRFFVAVPGLVPEEEIYECAYCKGIFKLKEIGHSIKESPGLWVTCTNGKEIYIQSLLKRCLEFVNGGWLQGDNPDLLKKDIKMVVHSLNKVEIKNHRQKWR